MTYRLLRIRDVETRISKKQNWIYVRIRRGHFPKQVSVGPGAVAWVESEIDDWIKAHIDERDGVNSAA